MGVRGGSTTSWIYVSENMSQEFRQDPKDPDQEQYRNINVYTRFRVVDSPSQGAFFFGAGTELKNLASNPLDIVSFISGTLSIRPSFTNPTGTLFRCIGDSLELLEPGTAKLKETQVWRAVGAWTDI